VEDARSRDELGKVLHVRFSKGRMSVLERRLKAILYPAHLQRTGSIALIAGTWLTLFSQGGALWTGELDGWPWVKIFLNYLTPFVVANFGLLSRKSKEGKEHGGEY
jgi:hypothetical protein